MPASDIEPGQRWKMRGAVWQVISYVKDDARNVLAAKVIGGVLSSFDHDLAEFRADFLAKNGVRVR